MIGDMNIGGDVANTTVLSGYQAGLATIESSAQSNICQLSQATAPTAVTIPTPIAQANGQITAFIAGNVTNSVFAASVLPISQIDGHVLTTATQTFGNPRRRLPAAWVGSPPGSKGRSTTRRRRRTCPKTAFYAKTVSLTHAVVVPPRRRRAARCRPRPRRSPCRASRSSSRPRPRQQSTTKNVVTATTGSGSGSSNVKVGITSTTNPDPNATPKGPRRQDDQECRIRRSTHSRARRSAPRDRRAFSIGHLHQLDSASACRA